MLLTFPRAWQVLFTGGIAHKAHDSVHAGQAYIVKGGAARDASPTFNTTTNPRALWVSDTGTITHLAEDEHPMLYAINPVPPLKGLADWQADTSGNLVAGVYAADIPDSLDTCPYLRLHISDGHSSTIVVLWRALATSNYDQAKAALQADDMHTVLITDVRSKAGVDGEIEMHSTDHTTVAWNPPLPAAQEAAEGMAAAARNNVLVRPVKVNTCATGYTH